MTDTHDKISELLAAIGRKTSFTPDAVQEFNDLLTKVANLENTVTMDKTHISTLQNDLRQAVYDRDKNQRELSDYKEREKNLIERENTVTTLEQQKAVAQAESATFEKCFGLVFRNAEIRRTMTGMAPDHGKEYGGSTRVNEEIIEEQT